MKTKACIYCGAFDKEFCRAHILPQSLGKFENQPTLLGKVCADCDNKIGQSEDQFAHTGLAALLRPRIGLSQDRDRSPFRRRFAGHGPIDMKIKYLGTDGVLLEPDGVGDNELPPAMPLPQLHFVYADGKKKCVRIEPESFTRADVFEVMGGTLPAQVGFFGMNDEQYGHILEAFRQAGIPVGSKRVVRPPTDKDVLPVLATGQFTFDKRYFQAIAKIAFHYYLGMNLSNCYMDGTEEVFDPLRQFILYGEGRAEAFVSERRGYFIDDLRNGCRLPYYGHIFVAEVSNKWINVKAQFFVGPDTDPPYYEVLLCKEPFIVRIQPSVFGHNYVYIEPSKRTQYAGMVHQLGVNNRIIIPSRRR